MKIHVTEAHISVAHGFLNTGATKRSTHCPVALAIQSAIGALPAEVSVGPNQVDFLPLQGRMSARLLPNKAINFIYDFDSNHNVEPFEFELAVPEVTT